MIHQSKDHVCCCNASLQWLARRAWLDFLTAAPFATVATLVWIVIAYYFHQSMIDAVTGGQDALGQRLPPQVRWKADNYNHLHEQPTIFYALMLFAALTGGASAGTLTLAWAYVAGRIVHSLVQATVNRVVVRFSVFAICTLLLVVIAARELLRVLG